MPRIGFALTGKARKGGDLNMIQIDIPMPENCAQCPCYGLIMFENACNITMHKFTHNMFDGRAKDCPLKEQEPILLENQHKPYGISTNANSPWISRCPKCGKKVEGKQTRFCKYCGQEVKWE